jgi:tryptophanyl-tRNA synthetase
MVQLQNKKDFDKMFCMIADHHALTNMFLTDHNISFKKNLESQVLILTAYLIASGIDENNSCLFL